MLNTHSYEDKTYESALEKGLNDLKVTADEVFTNAEEITEGKLFKSKKNRVDILLKEDVKRFIQDFFNHLKEYMGIDLQEEIRIEDDIFNVILVSDSNNILIGKEGKNLNALQLILRQAIQTNSNFNVKVNLDAGNYKAKKIKNLEYEMKKIIKDVQKTKMDVELDPMNSYQRRIIHNLAHKFENVTTVSTGTGKDRHITIKYKEEE